MLHGDHAAMADLTHRSVVDGMGGREEFVKRLSSIFEEMKGAGFAITELHNRGAADLVEDQGIFYAVVPYDLRMTGPGGRKGTSESYLVAVSLDGADSWKFVDGGAVAGDREKLKRVIKRFPDGLALPEIAPTRWEE